MKKQLLSLCVVALISLFAGKVANAQYYAPDSAIFCPWAYNDSTLAMDAVAESVYSPWHFLTVAKEAGAGITPYLSDQGADFAAGFKVCWDTTYLYLYVEIIDDIEEDYVIGKSQSWTWDNCEVFIDLDTNSNPVDQNLEKIQLRFSRGLKSAAGVDSLVESTANGVSPDLYKFKVVDSASDINIADKYVGSGWKLEVAIPWVVAVSGTIDPNMLDQIADVIGFDIGVADADGDGTGSVGGRNVAGGSQAFWDLDTVYGTGAEDNSYQNRRVYGFMTLAEGGCGPGCYCATHPCGSSRDETTNNQVTIFPNPSQGIITFSNLEGIKLIEIYDIAGTKIKSISVTGNDATVSDLHSGIYFARINEQTIKFAVR